MFTSIVTSASLVKSPARPKPPRPNPRRKLIDPAKGTPTDRAIARSIIVRSALNARCLEIVEASRELLSLMTQARERDEGALYAELTAAGFDPCACDLGTLKHVDEDCAGFEWTLNQFIDAIAGNCIPRTEEEMNRLYPEDETSPSQPAPDSPVRARRKSSASTRVPR